MILGGGFPITRRSVFPLLSLSALLAVGVSCGGSRSEPTFDVAPTLANREEITEALRAVGGGLEARVVLMLHVDRDGRVTEVRVQQGSGDQGLDDAALWIGERMRFEPAHHEGQPVAAWVTVPVTFDVVRPGTRPPRLRNAEEVEAILAREHASLSGVVHLRIRVNSEGVVRMVRDRQATNRELLGAARRLAHKLEFWPALRGFREVDTWITVVFEFDGLESRVWVEEAESSE